VVAQGHHPGDGTDPVPSDVPHRQEHAPVGQQHGVVPVTADQVPLAGRPVPRSHVDSGRLDRLGGLRDDRPLQPYRQLVLFARPFLGAGQLFPGDRERDLGMVLGRDVLIGTTYRDHGAAAHDGRLGEGAQLPHAGVIGPDDAERGGDWAGLPRQPVPEGPHRGHVLGQHTLVQVGEPDRLPRHQPEQRERGRRPVHLTGDQVLFPAAGPAQPLCLFQQRRQPLSLAGITPGDNDAVENRGEAGLHDVAPGYRHAADAPWLPAGEHLAGGVEQAAGRGRFRVHLKQRAPSDIGRGTADRVAVSLIRPFDHETVARGPCEQRAFQQAIE
jgi:hypothetical protein